MTLLLLISFATQLLLKEGITIPKLESSKYWDNKMVMLGIYYHSPFRTKLENQCMENGRVFILSQSIQNQIGKSQSIQNQIGKSMYGKREGFHTFPKHRPVLTRHGLQTTSILSLQDICRQQWFITMVWFIMQPTCRPKALKGMIKSRQTQVSTILLWSTILSMMRRALQHWMHLNNCAEYNPDHVTSLQIADLVKRHVGILYMMEQTIFTVLSKQNLYLW